MSGRPFSEIISIYRSRFEGLSEEYQTIKSKWMHLRSILLDDRILPDISKDVNTTIEWLLDLLEEKLSRCEDISRSSIDAEINLERDTEMRHVADLLFLIARFMNHIKSAFYQRTVSLEIPYVIAGLPISPETRWGDESYLIAADNVIKDYKSTLDLQGFPWSGFTSYTQMHPQFRGFPGASYSSFSSMFHIALSSEMKYFLNGFVVLSHELAHATVESLCRQREEKLLAEVMYRFIYVFHEIKGSIYRFHLTGVNKTKYCKDCPIGVYFKHLVQQKGDLFTYIDKIWNNKLMRLINEIACDLIGMTISGRKSVV